MRTKINIKGNYNNVTQKCEKVMVTMPILRYLNVSQNKLPRQYNEVLMFNNHFQTSGRS